MHQEIVVLQLNLFYGHNKSFIIRNKSSKNIIFAKKIITMHCTCTCRFMACALSQQAHNYFYVHSTKIN